MGGSGRRHMRDRVAVLVLAASALAAQSAKVPFVGCPSTGQAEGAEAPKGTARQLQIASGAARRLAFYKAAVAPGVLAPRGWHCAGFYGSSGSGLTVSPESAEERTNGKIKGPAIELVASTGETGSGQFEIAGVLARLFPSQRAFVQHVVDLFDLPANEFGSGPFPKDQLTVQTGRFVEFVTPPNSDGLGTVTLLANDEPIEGVAILKGQAPDLVVLRVRLPRELRDLAPVIINDLLIREGGDAR